MVMMEGILWKWTNYLSGWQPRWFILDYGVLSYYRSQEDVHLGSRGSVKMSCCEILINNNDPVRIDLKIPPENLFIYLKAATSAERQKWLVALGTSKACLVDSNYEEQQIQIDSMSYVKEKMKELILCRSIMLDQVQQIKHHTDQYSDQNKTITEATTLLSATCDTFVSNLQDIMEIVEDNLNSLSSSPASTPQKMKYFPRKSQSSTPSTPLSYSGSSSDGKSSAKYSNFSYDKDTLNRIQKVDNNHQLVSPNSDLNASFDEYKNRNLPLKDIVSQQMYDSLSHKDSSVSSASSTSSLPVQNKQQSPDIVKHNILLGFPSNQPPQPSDHQPLPTTQASISNQPQKNEVGNETRRVVTRKSIFGIASVRFEDVQFNELGLIPTQSFLNACSNIIPVFDSLGSTTFAPVKMDIQGNIKKIQIKYDTDRIAFEYLQNMIFQEIKSNETTSRNSATDALLWLKRALEFILVFLSEVSRGNQDLVAAADIAYSKSLKKYHGWMVRGVFALVVKACPYYKDFLKALSNNGCASDSETISELTSCVDHLGKVVIKLNNYYRKNKLDVDTVI